MVFIPEDIAFSVGRGVALARPDSLSGRSPRMRGGVSVPLFVDVAEPWYISVARSGELPAEFAGAAEADVRVDTVPLAALADEELLRLSQDRVLSLDLTEMQTIQAHFIAEGRPPTDAELETLAQTWSEHCVHKTFRAKIDLTHTAADGTVTTYTADHIVIATGSRPIEIPGFSYADPNIIDSTGALALTADAGFIDESVVRQMILDGAPDDLPRTGNPTLPASDSREAFHRHPLAFAG